MFGGLFKTTSLAALLAAGMAFGGASAQAADLGGDCCADLEERVAELEATTARKGNRKVSLTVSGWVNEAVMFWDDGVESNAYQVTNLVAQTRFRFVGSAKINADWSAGYLLELGVVGADSRTVSNGGVSVTAGVANAAASSFDDSGAGLAVRHSAWWIQSKQLGKVWVGQTSAATDGIMEINLANTSHFAGQNTQAYGGGFEAIGSGLLLREFMGGGGTTAAQIGEGERQNVVKYESPTLAGFVLSAAWGEDDMWDVALRYAGEFNGIKVAAGIGYMEFRDGNGTTSAAGSNLFGCTDAAAPAEGVDCHQFGVSGAVMHVPTGLYVHAAYGVREDDNATAVFDEMSQLYIQAGIEQKFFPLGKTTIFGEYQRWEMDHRTNALFDREMTMWGLGINQSIEAAAMDLYLTYKNFDPQISGVAIEEFQSVTAGARIQF